MGQDHGGGEGADQDDYEPRRHDALIEPLFGGLAAPSSSQPSPATPTGALEPPPRAGRGAWAMRSLGLFAALLALGALGWLARGCAL